MIGQNAAQAEGDDQQKARRQEKTREREIRKGSQKDQGEAQEPAGIRAVGGPSEAAGDLAFFLYGQF